MGKGNLTDWIRHSSQDHERNLKDLIIDRLRGRGYEFGTSAEFYYFLSSRIYCREIKEPNNVVCHNFIVMNDDRTTQLLCGYRVYMTQSTDNGAFKMEMKTVYF